MPVLCDEETIKSVEALNVDLLSLENQLDITQARGEINNSFQDTYHSLAEKYRKIRGVLIMRDFYLPTNYNIKGRLETLQRRVWYDPGIIKSA